MMELFYLLAIFLWTVCVGSSIGNISLLTALTKSKYRSVTAEFLKAITVSGILCGCTLTPTAFAATLTGGHSFGKTSCIVQAKFLSAFELSRKVLMVCLALERYLVSRHCGGWKNIGAARIVIFAIFLISSFFTTFPLVFGNPQHFTKAMYYCYTTTDLMKLCFDFVKDATPSGVTLYLSIVSLAKSSVRIDMSHKVSLPVQKLPKSEIRSIVALARFNISLSALELLSCCLAVIAELFLHGQNASGLLKWSLTVSSLVYFLQPFILICASSTLRKRIEEIFLGRISVHEFRIISSSHKLRPRESTSNCNTMPHFLAKNTANFISKNSIDGKKTSMINVTEKSRKASISFLSYELNHTLARCSPFVLPPLQTTRVPDYPIIPEDIKDNLREEKDAVSSCSAVDVYSNDEIQRGSEVCKTAADTKQIRHYSDSRGYSVMVLPVEYIVQQQTVEHLKMNRNNSKTTISFRRQISNLILKYKSHKEGLSRRMTLAGMPLNSTLGNDCENQAIEIPGLQHRTRKVNVIAQNKTRIFQ